ncbi:flavodoxin-like protein [Catenaria anguillulae PL171]|uniref:Flavodoxin-like protein n=1 Tax=Catenaria anguillulae PL171 TaxID=765915 RepID=A0A1Y2HCP1_9FUNG|nr:flavodoxin-like protein [Catenaria anguillulae PL171]
MTAKAKIAIIYYSTYGHVLTLAKELKAGIESTSHAEATIYRVAETLPKEVLEKMHAPPAADFPLATPETLKEADGILLGFPTRFGIVPAQLKAFLDSTGQLWGTQALAGKPIGFFFSTASQSGGQESTALTLLPYIAHHGLVFVPNGYSNSHLFNVDEVVGGSAWGAGTVAGPTGARQPSDKEKEVARTQGKNFATFAAKLKNAPAL